MRRTVTIAAAVLLALTASGQSPAPSAESSWASLLLVLGGLAGLFALVIGGRAAWRIVSAPIVTLNRLEQVVLRPVEGNTALVERVKALADEKADAADLDALRLEMASHVAAHASDHAVTMAILKEIRSAVRAPNSRSSDDSTEG